MFTFDFSWLVTGAEFALTWWLQAGLLVAAGLIAALLFQRRGAATESTVYKLTLLAAIACPLLTMLLSLSGVAMFTIDLKSHLVSAPAVDPAPMQQTPTPFGLETNIDSVVSADLGAGKVTDSNDATGPNLALQQNAPLLIESVADPFASSIDQPLSSAVVTPEPKETLTPQPANSPWWGRFYAFLLLGWVVGTAVLVIRLLADLINSRKLCSASAQADESAGLVCEEIASQLRVRAPRVLVNPFINSPCLVGHWRPVVVLPEDTLESSYVEVFLHELAHLRRSDWLWCMLGRLATALLWTQPLLWVLTKRSAVTAEDVCDDYVLQHGGNREGYVQQLVEIAETRLPPQALAGVAMVSFNSSLGKRVKRILDSTREISTTVGYRFVLMAAATMLILTSLVGLVYIGQPHQVLADEVQESVTENHESKQEGQSETKKQSSMKESDNGKSEAGKDGKKKAKSKPTHQVGKKIVLPKEITGIVLGPNGKPVAGAKIYMEDSKFKRESNLYVPITVAETKSGPDGTYRFDATKFDFSGNEVLVAAANGFGPDKSKLLFQDNTPTLRLVDDRPINGRVLNAEGQPIAGVQVSVRRCVLAKDMASVDEWIANKRPDLITDSRSMFGFNRDPQLERTRFPGVATINHGSKALPTTVTDVDGKFQLVGLGTDRKCTLVFSSPEIATEGSIVVTRKMKPFKAFSHRLVASSSYVHHGANLNFIASLSQPIVGKVVDADSRDPLVGLPVRLYQQGKSTMSLEPDLVSGKTNDKGEFRLTGARSGVKRSIMFSPNVDSPYFETELEIEKTSGTQPVVRDVELAKAVWLSGTVTNQNGEGVSSLVQYYPYRDNTHAERYPNFNPIITGSAPDQIFTDEEGSFRIRAIPGRGVLAAKVRDNMKKSAYLSDVPADLLERMGGEQMPKMFNPWSAKSYHWMREIEIPKDAREFSNNVVLTKGETHRIKIQDPEGNELASVRVMGRTFPPRFDPPLDGSEAEIIGLGPKTRRLVAMMHSERGLGKTFFLESENRPDSVRLEKCATLVGRVVNVDGEGVADVVLNVTPENDADNWSRELQGQTTKTDGRFNILLPPGGPITVWAYTSRGPNVRVMLTPKAGAKYDVGELKDGDKVKQPKATKLTAARRPVAENESATVKLVFEGQVLTSEGKPAVGATVCQANWQPSIYKQLPAKVLDVTGSDGRFRYELTNPDENEMFGMIVVKHADYDDAIRFAGAFETTGVLEAKLEQGMFKERYRDVLKRNAGPIRLRNDRATIKGRVVDLEGNGVENVKITVLSIQTGTDLTLSKWESEAAKSNATDSSLNNTTPWSIYGPMVPALFPGINTDSEGRFTVSGIEKQFLVKLVATGAGIEANVFYARTSGGPRRDIPIGLESTFWKTSYFGNDVQLVAAPAKPVVGKITDAETGKPIAGAVLTSMTSYRHTSTSHKRIGSSEVFAVTDASGRYRIDGLPSSKETPIRIAHPEYTRAEFLVNTDGSGLDPVKRNADLVRGIRVSGRVVDASTQKGVVGQLVFLPLPGDKPVEHSFHLPIGRTDAQGKYDVLLPQRPGNLCFRANSNGEYVLVKTPKAEATRLLLYSGLTYNAVSLVDAAGTTKTTVNMSVKPLERITGTAVDESGEKLSEFLYVGRTSQHPRWSMSDGPDQQQAAVFGLKSGEAREVYAIHQARKLAGIIDVEADSSTFQIKMKPWASLKGILVDKDGIPIANATIFSGRKKPVKPQPSPSSMMSASQDVVRLPPTDTIGNVSHATDDDGAFDLIGLVPGIEYQLRVRASGQPGRASFIGDAKLAPGEHMDLGTVTVK